MKNEYDFSQGERGKFYQPDSELRVPIYLDPETMKALERLSRKRGVDITTLVNDWIRNDLSTIDSVQD